MPRYRVKFLLETPLAFAQDVTLTFRNHAITFFFSGRVDQHFIYARTVTDADNWKMAIENAEKAITPALDIISMHRKAPTMLHSAVEVLKAEQGARRRAFILTIERKQEPVPLDEVVLGDIQAALTRDRAFSRSCVRMLRYSFRALTVLERFVFSWLAFENMSGSSTIRPQCPNCDTPLNPRPAFNRDAAFEIVRSAKPALTRQEFDLQYQIWWNKLRNPVFHGGKAVTTKMRIQMLEAMDAFVPPMESRTQAEMEFARAYPGKHPNDGTFQLHLQSFVEFQSNSPDEFATDVPTATQLRGAEHGDFELLPQDAFNDW